MSTTAHVDLVELIADAVVRAHPSMPRAEARPIAADAVTECERAGRLAPVAALRLALRHADGPVFVEDLELSLVPDEPVAWDPDGLSTSLRVLRGGRANPAAPIEDVEEDDADGRPDARRRHLSAPSAGVAVGVAVALALGAGQRYRGAEPAPHRAAASAPAARTEAAVPQRRVVAEAPATRFARKRAVVHHHRRTRRTRIVPVSAPAPVAASIPARPAAQATPSPAPAAARVPTPAPRPAAPKRSAGQTWASDFTP